MQKKAKIWDAIGTVIVIIAVILAIALAGVRLFGLKVFTVLSGSMEPTYHVGSVIYVKPTPASEIRVGDAITFVMNEDLVVATHRVVEINEAEDGAKRFVTKGDASENVDGNAVHEKNVIGKPVFTIPYLGYVENFIHYPPGTYITIGVIAVLIILFFIPFGGKSKEKKPEEQKTTAN